MVPITSAVLSAVPAERSGMAASATNTSREIGAVTGVAILGSLVYSQLHASLVTPDEPPGRAEGVPGPGHQRHRDRPDPAEHQRLRGFGKLVQEVIGAAYTAFHDGLHAALYLSAGLALAAGLLALITLRSPRVNAGS